MHGPTCIFWANLTPCSLEAAAAFEEMWSKLSSGEKAAAVAVIAAVVLLAGAAVAFANVMAPEPSPCLQPDTAGGDPCTTPVELGARRRIQSVPVLYSLSYNPPHSSSFRQGQRGPPTRGSIFIIPTYL